MQSMHVTRRERELGFVAWRLLVSRLAKIRVIKVSGLCNVFKIFLFLINENHELSWVLSYF